MSLEETVLNRIRPSDKETKSIMDSVRRLKKRIERYLRTHRHDVNVILVGSVAKGTFLSSPDLDMFLMFPQSVPEEDMVRIGLAVGEEILQGERMYAEHPYTRGTFEGLTVDLVPCYAISDTSKLMSAVDRTPFHTEYVISRTDERLRDEIRLLKVFMRGIGAYGAEPNTRGFSGYLCEALTIYYGGFLNVVRAAADWKEGVTISLEKRGPAMLGPMILYDPVDPKRNVASAVHIDTFATFVAACKRYLEEPGDRFFFPKERPPLTEAELRELSDERGSRLVTAVFDRPDVNRDNLFSQIWKTRYAIARKLDSYDFTVLRAVHDMTRTKIVIVFELERDMLSKTFRHIGPPVWVRAASSFLAKWKENGYGGPFIDEGQWNVIAERRHRSVVDMLNEEVAVAGIGRDIIPETLMILEHDDTFVSVDKGLLTELIDPKHPWDV
ncbi:MAG: CCA tRNA nucleotidyltransferase [Methanomassiliicoccaceae archaeon]|jgi:tRNA nucleotidyltransferase (CCA-adding enzyme)|nr:CCA tRNA nucleotidyltransferase [Methanomassiliicoccaceae archaeon]